MNEKTISPRTLTLIRVIDRMAAAVARHWLLLASLFLFVFSTLPLIAPVLVEFGLDGPAQVIYTLYSFTCHQLAYRSFFYGGAQPAYSLAQLQDLLHVSNPWSDVFYWRAFQGNGELGYKVAYCERDVAIYSSMFLASVLFGLVRTRLPRLSWRWYLILAIVPMGLDGGTQLLTLRESDPILRTITGLLFGVLSVWLIWPMIDEAMREAYSQTTQQLKVVDRRMDTIQVNK